MNKNDFIAEALRSPSCPSDFITQYEYFCRYQRMVLEILKEFHRVCEKNGINYFVSYGSLLGLIRDGGQIPWDYDIDTFVPVSQKEELLKAIRQDMSEDFYAVCPELDPACRHYIIRVCPKQYNSAAVHLDVFWYCGAPEDEKSRKRFTKNLRRCAQIRFAKKVNIKEESVGNKKRALKLMAAKTAFSVFNLKRTDKKYRHLIRRYPISSSKYVVSADFFAGDCFIPAKMFTETMIYSTNVGEFRIPKDYDGFLKMIYGNYLEYPPMKNRIREVLNACRRFKHFENLNQKCLSE